jgi:predicted alpha/beta hydrolase
MQVSERVIRSDGIEIATEAFGDPANSTVLLVMGAMASMLWWPEEFCEELAARGRRVIRYDHRDTGLSTKYEPGEPPYTLGDMADDAVRVLDGYGISAAHLVGMSMGGVISQLAEAPQARGHRLAAELFGDRDAVRLHPAVGVVGAEPDPEPVGEREEDNLDLARGVHAQHLDLRHGPGEERGATPSAAGSAMW